MKESWGRQEGMGSGGEGQFALEDRRHTSSCEAKGAGGGPGGESGAETKLKALGFYPVIHGSSLLSEVRISHLCG